LALKPKEKPYSEPASRAGSKLGGLRGVTPPPTKKKARRAARPAAHSAPAAETRAAILRPRRKPPRRPRPFRGRCARQALFFAEPAGSRAGIFFLPFFLLTLMPLAFESASLKLYSILYTAFSGLFVFSLFFCFINLASFF